jgi:hypothetical protein
MEIEKATNASGATGLTRSEYEELATPVVALRKFERDAGISSTSSWRWTKAGWLHPIRIANKLYLTREDLAQFYARAKAGEFAKAPSGVCAKLTHNPNPS